MKKIVCRHNLRKPLAFVLIGLFSLFVFGVCFAAYPQEHDSAAAEETVPIEIEKSTSDYEYQVDDRPDPFAPFVSGPAQANPMVPDEIVENNEDKVLVEETATTRSGKVLKNEIAMVLKREGEE